MALTEINSKSIKDGDVQEDDIAISNAPSDGKFLQYKDSSDKLTWADVPAGVGGANGVAFNDTVTATWGTTATDLEIKSDGTSGQVTVSDELKVKAGTTVDALKVDQAAVTVNTTQLVAYSDVVVGSPTSGEQHYLGLAEDAANGTNTVRFQAPASLANTLTYTLNLAGGSAGDVLKLNGANIEWGTAGAGAVGGSTDKIFWENGQTVTTNYTLGDTFGAAANAMSAGPITINNGVTVTINSGETWTIV